MGIGGQAQLALQVGQQAPVSGSVANIALTTEALIPLERMANNLQRCDF